MSLGKATRYAGLCLLGWLLSYIFVFHEMVFSGFKTIPGDSMDTQLILLIQEHWFDVLRGKANWLDLGFFYPLENTLGLSDAFFLFGMSHSVFRLLGFDIFGAYAANLTFISFAGFMGMMCFLWKGLRMQFVHSVFFSFLFIISHTVSAAALANHMQFLTIWYCPWFLFFALRTIENLGGKGSRSHFWAFCAAASLAMSFYNAFYFSWFMVFYLGLASFVYWIISTVFDFSDQGRFSLWSIWNRISDGSWALSLKKVAPLSTCFVVFGVFSIPFFLTYVPILKEFGSRDWINVKGFIPQIADFFHVHESNFLWGWMNTILCSPTSLESELCYGFTLGLFALFVVSGILLILRKDKRSRHWFAISLFFSVLICWLLLFQVAGISLWEFVFKWVPGASAIRVPFRFNAFLIVPVILVIALSSEAIANGTDRLSDKLRMPSIVFLMIVVAGQWTLSDSHAWRIKPAEVRQELKDIPSPPNDAEVFYIEPSKTGSKKFNYLAEFKAMIVAQHFGIHTINGYSGVFPTGYPFREILRNHPNTERYGDAMLRWLLDHKVEHGIYSLDYEEGAWNRIGGLYDNYRLISSNITPYKLGDSILFDDSSIHSIGFSAEDSVLSGFTGVEGGSRWTLGDTSKFAVWFSDSPETDLVMRINARGHLNMVHRLQQFTVLVNGEKVSEFHYDLDHNEGWRKIPISKSVLNGNLMVVTIQAHNAVKPSEISDSIDSRVLGMAVRQIILESDIGE